MSLIDELNISIKNDNISDDERALMHTMRKSLLDNFIQEHHKNAISTYKSGKYTTYTTRVKGGKKISAQSIEALYMKLYEFYTGKALKESATICSIFNDALVWHYTPEQGETRKRQIQLYNELVKGSVICDKPIKDITTHDLDKFFKSFNNKVTSTKYGNIKSLLNLIFDYASQDLNIFPYNICRSLKVNLTFVAESKVGRRAYSRKEAERIVTHIYFSTNVYDEAIVFCFYTGLRYSELSDLRFSDFYDDVVLITHANTESGNIKTGEDGSGELALSSEALNLIKRYRAERPDSDLVFPNKRGHMIQDNHLNERLKSICEELNIPYRSIHKVRSYVLSYRANKCSILSAQKQGRHTSPVMTNRYINKSVTDQDREEVKIFDFGIQTDSDHVGAKEITL